MDGSKQKSSTSIACPVNKETVDLLEKYFLNSKVLQNLTTQGASINKSVFSRACILLGLEKIDEFGKDPTLYLRASTVTSTQKTLEKIIKNSKGSKND